MDWLWNVVTTVSQGVVNVGQQAVEVGTAVAGGVIEAAKAILPGV